MRNTKKIQAIAAACHQVNKTWCEAHGDHSQVAWEDASSEVRKGTLDGVRRALKGEGPQELHASWCALKRENGWTFGEEKSAEAKTHPCLMPYDKLPEHQRTKDSLFLATVRSMDAVLSTSQGESRLARMVRVDIENRRIGNMVTVELSPRVTKFSIMEEVGAIARYPGVAWRQTVASEDVVIEDEEFKLIIDYPVSATRHSSGRSAGGWTRGQILEFIRVVYAELYAISYDKHGDAIYAGKPWGHAVTDLVLTGCIYSHREKTLRIEVDS